MKKKILIFSLVYLPRFIGGAEIAIKEITDRLGEDFEFDMVTLRGDDDLPQEERVGNITVYRIGFSKKNQNKEDFIKFPMYFIKVFYPALAAFKALKLYRKQKYHAVWSVLTYMGFPAVFFKWIHPNVPMLLTIQDGDSIEHITKRARIKMVNFFFKRIFKTANRIQTISNYLADFAKSMGAKCPVEVVPNGVDLKRFAAIFTLNEIEEWKNKIGKKAGDSFVVTASRLVAKNATSVIIESLSFLDPHVKLAIAGVGPEESGLHVLAHEKKLSERVIFLDQVSHDDLPKLLKACDVFVRPSRSEGFGNSFVEAMAAHVPVIATPVGGIVDFLRDGETGLFTKVDDPQDLAHKIKTLLENKNVREPIVHNAFEMVVKKYDWDIVAGKMKEVFYEL